MRRGSSARGAVAVIACMLALLAGETRAAADTGAERGSAENRLVQSILAADQSASLDELVTIVRVASVCCRESRAVSRALSGWLRESHPIYNGRLPTEANQFHGFLLASLGAFVPGDELYGYVKAGLRFADHAFDVAAAAVAARPFAERADELLPLMEPYLRETFEDSWVDVSTPALNYPPANPTRARHEIIRTLIAFGPRATAALPRLDEMARCPKCGSYAMDDSLPARAAVAAQRIRSASTGVVGHDEAAADAPPLRLMNPRQPMPPAMRSVKLLDQEGESLQFAGLRGRPFVLAFFYTHCANPQKCVLTVRRLGALASECAASGLSDRVGIYGMTYDPQFDSPSILKRYGTMYGMKFDQHVRLLKTTDVISEELRHQLALRVSYGAGSVNQHGIQLYVFDKQGRLAALHDNETWSPTDVRHVLAGLAAE